MTAKHFFIILAALLLQLLTPSCDRIVSTPTPPTGILLISFDSSASLSPLSTPYSPASSSVASASTPSSPSSPSSLSSSPSPSSFSPSPSPSANPLPTPSVVASQSPSTHSFTSTLPSPSPLSHSSPSTAPSASHSHLSQSPSTLPHVGRPPLSNFGATTLNATTEIPDTNSFYVEILNEKQQKIFSGTYCELPKQMELTPGNYSISAVSRRQNEPLFDTPQYGDIQTVTIYPEEISAVHLACTLLNSALRIQADKAFIAEYPGGTFYVNSSAGSLVYAYGEKRTGYFKPGTIWLDFSYAGRTTTLLTRELKPKEQLILRINNAFDVKSVSPVADLYGEGFSIEIDTTLNHKTEDYYFNLQGGGNSDTDTGSVSDLSGALSIGEARKKATEELSGVWVYGFIVGGDCTSSSCSFSPPFKSQSNIVLSASLLSADKQNCLAVQLQKGDIRDILNLVDHPNNLGRLVYIKGDLVPKYFGIAGLQNLTDYRLK